MDFQHPLRVVTPTLDGEVLMALSGAESDFTGREVHRLIGRASEEGVRKALERLVVQGIVHSRRVGSSRLYGLNRQHLAAAHIEGLATLRSSLIEHCRQAIGAWDPWPALALLFGSAARGDSGSESDLDVLVIRPAGVDEDAVVWREQLAALERNATSWTGNDTRIVEYGEGELVGIREPVVTEAFAQGIELFGSRRRLRRLIEGGGQ